MSSLRHLAALVFVVAGVRDPGSRAGTAAGDGHVLHRVAGASPRAQGPGDPELQRAHIASLERRWRGRHAGRGRPGRRGRAPARPAPHRRARRRRGAPRGRRRPRRARRPAGRGGAPVVGPTRHRRGLQGGDGGGSRRQADDARLPARVPAARAVLDARASPRAAGAAGTPHGPHPADGGVGRAAWPPGHSWTTAICRGIFVFAAAAQDARRLAAEDPSVQAGRLALEFHEWWLAEGVMPSGPAPSGGR